MFNPPQIFSDTETAAHVPSGIQASGLGSTVVVHWSNNDIMVCLFIFCKYSMICDKKK